jgi:hypothetical protein
MGVNLQHHWVEQWACAPLEDVDVQGFVVRVQLQTQGRWRRQRGVAG